MSHCTQPTMYKFLHFKIEIKTKVDSYIPCKAMAQQLPGRIWSCDALSTLKSSKTNLFIILFYKNRYTHLRLSMSPGYPWLTTGIPVGKPMGMKLAGLSYR